MRDFFDCSTASVCSAVIGISELFPVVMTSDEVLRSLSESLGGASFGMTSGFSFALVLDGDFAFFGGVTVVSVHWCPCSTIFFGFEFLMPWIAEALIGQSLDCLTD